MDQNTITSDQIKIKEIISSTKKSIPNNEQRDNEKRKEEELKFQKKLKNKKIRYIVSSALTVILTILAIVIFLFGAPKSIDSLSLNSDKKLLNQDWVESVYTEFNLRLQTPDALVRSSDSLSNDLNYVSIDGSISINLYVKNKTEDQDVLNDLLDDFKKRNFKIVHVSNFGQRQANRLYNISIAKKLTNGLIRNGHDVINISDRDVVRLNRGLRNFNKGSDYLDNLLLETIDNYKPDAMVLGHVNNIQEKTLEFAKNKYKNLKITQWFEDNLSKNGPDPVTNKKNFLKYIDILDEQGYLLFANYLTL